MTLPTHSLPQSLRPCLFLVLTSTCLALLPIMACQPVSATPMFVAGAGIGEDGAARAAAAHSGGKVLSVRSAEVGGKTIYEVTVLRGDGQVVVLRVDALSGAVIGG